MVRIEAILAAVLAISMAGCAASGKSKNPAILTPAPPTTTPASLKPVREPLSIPQTHVQLPPFQPVNMEALNIPATPAPEAPAPAPKPVRRTGGGPPQPPKPDAVAPPVQAAEPERPAIQEIVPADERKHFKELAEGRKREIRQLLEQAKGRRLTAAQSQLVKRIQLFVAQSDDAEKRGDMRQADALAERGFVLAKELAGGQ